MYFEKYKGNTKKYERDALQNNVISTYGRGWLVVALSGDNNVYSKRCLGLVSLKDAIIFADKLKLDVPSTKASVDLYLQTDKGILKVYHNELGSCGITYESLILAGVNDTIEKFTIAGSSTIRFHSYIRDNISIWVRYIQRIEDIFLFIDVPLNKGIDIRIVSSAPDRIPKPIKVNMKELRWCTNYCMQISAYIYFGVSLEHTEYGKYGQATLLSEFRQDNHFCENVALVNKAFNGLMENGILTVADLVKVQKELRYCDGVSDVAAKIIRQRLLHYGLMIYDGEAI